MFFFNKEAVHCLDCGYEGEPKKITKGSFILEIFLWLLFLLPGFIYSIWRLTSGRYYGCPDCKSEKILSLKKWQERNHKIAN